MEDGHFRNYHKNSEGKKRDATQNILALLSMMVIFFLIVSTLVIGRGTIYVLAKGTNANILKTMIGDTMPVIMATSDIEPIPMPSFSKILLGFEPNDPKSILSSEFLSLNMSKEDYAEANAEHSDANADSSANENEAVGRIVETTIQPGSASGYAEAGGVYVKNSTTYQINAADLLNHPLNYDKNVKGPKVLITHSHTSESYKPSEANFYRPSDPSRTQDPRFSVVRVGDEIENVLKQAGIEVIHDKKLHDYPNYNGSYKNSLETVEEYLKQYPSIQVVLDIHRDAMSRPDNTQLKVVTEIDGKKAAQAMIVCGSDQGGLYHPNWKNNLMFAMKLQQSMNEIYPTLARPIDFRKERFNMHTTNNSLIIEIGSNANTLEEAVLGGRATANALARLLK